jgi:PadR family transcriptional regulator PadR
MVARMAKKPDLPPDMLVLKTLTRTALHGYGIALSIKGLSGDVLKVKEGSLYRGAAAGAAAGWMKAEGRR